MFSEPVAPSSKGRFSVGIDTGGTYTDAVILDGDDHRVLATAKALTTRANLAIGVNESLRSVLHESQLDPEAISLVTVSTTLATNAVVERHAEEIGIVLIGFDDEMAARTTLKESFPESPVFRVEGGHNHNGDERCALDEDALRRIVRDPSTERISSFAVASAFAVRNPSHERRSASLIAEMTGATVTISSDLTSNLDAPRRALTAVLNAQLVGKIAALIDAVTTSIRELGISCPLMLVKGDGSRALASALRHRPIETVLSGPAASLIGAGWLTGKRDYLMSDVGGTTTDIGIVRNGRPTLTDDGASVGGWRTMVRAMDVRTTGLGGDSEVGTSPGNTISVGPGRIVALALLASRFPSVLTELRADVADTRTISVSHGRFLLRPFGAQHPSSHNRAGVSGLALNEHERTVLESVAEGPRPIRTVSTSLRVQRAIESLRRRGLVQVAGFTPSDAALVLGLQSNWDREASLLGAHLGARMRLMREPTDDESRTYAYDVWDAMVRASALAIFEAATNGTAPVDSRLMFSLASGAPRIGLLSLQPRVDVDLIAVGGPAAVFYPEVAVRVGASLSLPRFGDVANAVGAATGVVTETLIATVNGDGSGNFRAHSPNEVRPFTDSAAAIRWATTETEKVAIAQVEAMGAPDPEVRVLVDRTMMPGLPGDLGLLAATISVEATGWPSTFR